MPAALVAASEYGKGELETWEAETKPGGIALSFSVRGRRIRLVISGQFPILDRLLNLDQPRLPPHAIILLHIQASEDG